MTKDYCRPSSLSDVTYLADRLRREDVQEIQASSGSTPLEALTNGFRSSNPCITVVHGDEPVAMFGVVPTDQPEIASIWLLASDDLRLARKEFMRQTKDWLSKFHEKYPMLWNLVDARNNTHIRWLKWAGVVFLKRHESIGVESRPFLEFIHV